MSLCLMMDILFHNLSGFAMDKIAQSQGSAWLNVLHRIWTKKEKNEALFWKNLITFNIINPKVDLNFPVFWYNSH